MQRQDKEGIVIVCDFCRRDWDGQEPMIEGHHGSVLCLECLKLALVNQQPGRGGDEKYKCTLCLRFNIPGKLPSWRHPDHPEAIVCQECLYQAAKAFHRNPDVPWRWNPTDYLPPVHVPLTAASQDAPAEPPPAT
jgi:hypothetical protein